MSLRRRVEKRKTERMSNLSFRGMTFIFKVVDLIFPYVGRRIKRFGIGEGMTVVDYGCGPGRYATRLAKLVGETGKVYAIDIHELAIQAVKKKIEKQNFRNIEPILVEGYNSTLPDSVADVICAIDMFFTIKKPGEFLAELRRITKDSGRLIIDDGHQPRRITKQKILDSGLWDIVEETSDHLKCRPRGLKQ
jgi:ubiquinone/menaquinone biosynthesis C-methylase UbiE